MSTDVLMHSNVRYAHVDVKSKRTGDSVHVARMTDDRPDAAKRLQIAREKRGFDTARSAAEFFGWKYDTYIQHERGERGISRAAKQYAAALRVSEGWLLTGEGEGPEWQPAPEPLNSGPNVTWEQGPHIIRQPALGANDIEEKGVTVGGFGDDEAAFELNGEAIDYVRRPPGIIGRKNVFALRVSNTSMEPKFDDGDRVYVEERHPAVRDFVVVELLPLGDGRPSKSYIKRLVAMNSAKITVEQYNPRGLLEFGRHEIKKLYRVIPEKELRGEA